MPITSEDLARARYGLLGQPRRGDMYGLPENTGLLGGIADWIQNPAAPERGLLMGGLGDWARKVERGQPTGYTDRLWASLDMIPGVDDAMVKGGLLAAGKASAATAPFLGAIIAGPKARTADLEALEIAKGLKDQGRSDYSIYDTTGWWLSHPDGVPRFEIDDSASQFTQRSRIDAANEYIKNRGLPGDVASPDSIVPDSLKQEAFEYADNALRHNKVMDQLSHNELFEAYPITRFLSLKQTGEEGVRGSFSPSTNRIALAPEQLNTDYNPHSTLLHELNHAVQQYESMAKGGSPEITPLIKAKTRDAANEASDFAKRFEADAARQGLFAELDIASAKHRYADYYADAQKLIDYANHPRPSSVKRHIMGYEGLLHQPRFKDKPEARELYNRTWDIPKRHKMQDRNQYLSDWSWDMAQFLKSQVPENEWKRMAQDPRKPKSIVNAAAREKGKAQKKLEPVTKAKREADEAWRQWGNIEFDSPYEVYRKLAGEADARLTQKRMNLSAKERAARPFWLDYDVPLDNQVIYDYMK